MDLKDRFDLATSDGPTHAPLEERLQHGRRAVRRRAAGRALGTLVVVSTVAAGAATLSTGQDRATEPAAPAVSSPSPTPTRTIAVSASDEGWTEEEWARMNPRSGEVTVLGGVTVTNTLEPAVRGHLSVALDLTRDGERLFVLLVRRAGIVTSSWAEPAGRTLRQFAADENDPMDALPVASVPGTLGADLPLVGYDDGELFTVGGASIVRVVEDPIKDWCAPHATAAVELLHSGVTYFAVLGDGNCGGAFNKFGDSPSLEATVGRVRANINWSELEQAERERVELERELAEREQSDVE